MKHVRTWVSRLGVGVALASLWAGGALAQAGGALPKGHPPLPSSGAQTGAQMGGAEQGKVAAPADVPLPSGHPPVSDGKAPPSAEQLLQQLDSTPGLKERDKPFEMAAMIGRLYLHNGRAQDARALFTQAEGKAEGVRQLFVSERKKLPSAELSVATKESCPLPADAPLETVEREARARLAEGKRVAAVACARVGVDALLQVLAQEGNAALLVGDVPGALEAYGRALALEPAHEESLFSRSALLYETHGEDVKALAQARDGFRLLVERHPQGVRTPQARALLKVTEEAIAAGGVSKRNAKRASERRVQIAKEFPTMGQPAVQAGGAMASAGGPSAGAGAAQAGGAGAPALSREMVDAVQNVERTPEFEAGLDKALADGEEHLARGRYEDALASFRRVMPFRPQDGRTQAGLAWSLMGLKRQPMADRVWGVAVQSSPAAVEALGDTLQAKGNAQEARAVWSKLSESAPAYPGAASLKKKLQ